MRKSEDNAIYAEYQNPAAEREFRNKVFSPEALSSAIIGTPYRQERSSSPGLQRPPPTIEQLKERKSKILTLSNHCHRPLLNYFQR